MEKDYIYEPLKTYKNVLKEKHHNNTLNYFNDLVKKSNVDVELNKETIKKLNKYNKDYNNLKGSIKSYKNIRIFLILIIGILFLLPLIHYNSLHFEKTYIFILVSLLEVATSSFLIYLIFAKLNKHLNLLRGNVSALKEKIDKLYKESLLQMKPLNDLFEENIAHNLFKKTLPLINFDNYFNSKRLEYLEQKFKLNTHPNINRSTLFTKSGDINGNPFFISNDLIHSLGSKTYTGTKTIFWTTYTTINGKRVAQSRSQVLTATINKPYPYYNEQSYIVYGNEAAPNLIFNRTDSDAEILNENQISRLVKREHRKLLRKERKQTKTGGSYTTLANTEFEVLFGATNRNNEVQFRLLFTPLAQKQLLELMKDKEIGYGDNFDFSKHNMINIVYPEHLNIIDLEVSPDFYKSNDYKKIKEKFINYNNNYFKSLYFAFAPILSIPLYQQQKPHEYIYKDLYDSYASFYEHEKVVNKMGESFFKHPESKTRNILKTKHILSEDNKDKIEVESFGYKTKERVEYVSRLGGDGRTHLIPVYWTEFIPVKKKSLVEINVLEEDKELSYSERFEKYINSLKNKENINKNDVKRIGRFIARITKK